MKFLLASMPAATDAHSSFEKELPDLWKVVKGIYKEKGYTQKEELQQARVAHICRHGDYNKKTGKVKLWQI